MACSCMRTGFCFLWVQNILPDFLSLGAYCDVCKKNCTSLTDLDRGFILYKIKYFNKLDFFCLFF